MEKHPPGPSDCAPTRFTWCSLLPVPLTLWCLHLIQGSHSLEEEKAWSEVILAYLASFITIKACAISAGRNRGIEGLVGDSPHFLSLTKDLKYSSFKTTTKL